MSDSEVERWEERNRFIARKGFAVGHRVRVTAATSFEGMNGYYGHIVETCYDVAPIVKVELTGRIGGPSVLDEFTRCHNPWPLGIEEIEHVD